MNDHDLLTAERRMRLAEEVNLEKFARLFPEAFDRAYEDAQSLHAQAPCPEAVSDEPAHVFSALPRAER